MLVVALGEATGSHFTASPRLRRAPPRVGVTHRCPCRRATLRASAAEGHALSGSASISTVTRALLVVAAALFLLFGVASFVLPAWAAANFPWGVSPFIAMTIGGWSIGTALIAADAARVARISWIYPLLVYVWLFALLELIVAVAFLGRLIVAPLTFPYLGALVAALASAVPGIVDLARSRADRRHGDGTARRAIPRYAWLGAAVFVLGVGFLSVVTLLAQQGGGATEGRVVPDRMTLFTVRAFSAFFFALTASVASLVATRDYETFLQLGSGGLYLIVPITLASLLNLGLFDFVGRPGGALYLGAYVVVGALLVVVLWSEGRGSRRDREAG